MFNKAALSSYGFPYANVITLFQLVTMESVRAINVPMYTTIRRTTVAFTMLVEYLLTGKKHSVPVIGSVGIIILGALIAGARDLSFDPYSYGVVFAANICTAIYLASIARIGKSSGLNSFGLMWCNGVICLPALLIWTSVSGDIGALRNFPYLLFPGFQVVSLLSCILAFLINYFVVFLNTTINSALTQTICGNLKDVFTIGLGWMLFGGLPFDMMNLVGQTLGFLGSLLYAYSKLKGK
ncbi:UDP-N-acetylglucosamine transporter UGNT1 [Linum perenne]